ncbi:phosphotransferase family protein [Mycobacterium sp. AT1]|uniref:phosphotransferase family protein n=1 Tax=Mycobacterium sp. AT1 TaxID=1961706 RepID=UPI001E4FBEEF|nr:aminoglycoside phosphotransferase family protein [Mycobacterium sp. AT1]
MSGVRILDGTKGTSSRSRLGLTGIDVPESVFVKMAAADTNTRMLGELARLGENEARFYRDLASALPGAVPQSFGAEFDSLTGRFVIVLEDLTAGAPCRFPDVVHPHDENETHLLAELLGRVHGTFFDKFSTGASRRPEWSWSPSEDPNKTLVPAIMKLSARRLTQRTAVPVMSGRFIWENHRAVTHVIDHGPQTLVHGDPHPGNTYFRNGQAGLLDWQVLRVSHPARDLAYAMIFGMTTAARRDRERDVLEVYRQSLAAAGGPELRRDDLWLRYRQAAAYAFVSSLTTAGLGGMQSEAIALEGLRRTVDALDDLDTVTALRAAM